jgi:hypothetical protein
MICNAIHGSQSRISTPPTAVAKHVESFDIVTASLQMHSISLLHVSLFFTFTLTTSFLQLFPFDPLSKSPYRHSPDTFRTPSTHTLLHLVFAIGKGAEGQCGQGLNIPPTDY